jgi:uncharacterized protein
MMKSDLLPLAPAPGTRWLAALIMVVTALLAPGARAVADGAIEPLFQFPQSTLTIRTATGHAHKFNIWTADNPGRREQGLMYVRELDDHAGMLFPFPASQRVTMWMKNTYIPLDMLFIDAQGRIDYIAVRTTPLSLDLIEPPRAVATVLELKGGITERLGIHAGDKVNP